MILLRSQVCYGYLWLKSWPSGILNLIIETILPKLVTNELKVNMNFNSFCSDYLEGCSNYKICPKSNPWLISINKTVSSYGNIAMEPCMQVPSIKLY